MDGSIRPSRGQQFRKVVRGCHFDSPGEKLLFKSSVRELGISFRPNRWFLAAWLLPPIVAVAAIPASLLVPGASFTTDPMALLERFQGVFTQAQIEQMQAQTQSLPVHPFWLGLLQGLIAGLTVNAVAAFGEELGWRGLLQKELAWLGFWRSIAASRAANIFFGERIQRTRQCE